jgi:hypothetical protein
VGVRKDYMSQQIDKKSRQVRINSELHYAIKGEAARLRKSIKALVEDSIFNFLGLDVTLLGIEKKKALRNKAKNKFNE